MSQWDTAFPAPPAAAPQGAARRVSVGFAEPEKHRITVPLTYPLEVTIEGVVSRVEEITVCRLTARQVIDIVEAEDAPKDDAELVRRVTASMAGVQPEVLDGLWPEDSGRVAEAARPFMPAALVAAIERQAGEPIDGGTSAGA